MQIQHLPTNLVKINQFLHLPTSVVRPSILAVNTMLFIQRNFKETYFAICRGLSSMISLGVQVAKYAV